MLEKTKLQGWTTGRWVPEAEVRAGVGGASWSYGHELCLDSGIQGTVHVSKHTERYTANG